MWRMTPLLAILTSTATLALVVSPAPMAGASTVQSYSYTTSGNISGMASGPISFNPESYSGVFSTPGAVVLGSFATNPLPPTATLTYNNTPFAIDLNVGAPSGNAGSNPNTYQYQITGVLNGSIGGDGSSNMIATVTMITGSGSGLASTPPFPASDLLISPQGIAAPGGDHQGITFLTGQVNVSGLPLPSPAPEPSTVAVFGAALGAWTLRRRFRPRVKA